MEASRRVYRVLMRAYPKEIRERYGEEMVSCFSGACRDEVRDNGHKGLAVVWARSLPELIYTALKETSTMSNRDAHRSVDGTIIASFRPRGTVRALFVMALAQTLVTGIAVVAGLGSPLRWPVEIVSLNGFFVVVFAGSELQFRHTALEQTPAAAGPEG